MVPSVNENTSAGLNSRILSLNCAADLHLTQQCCPTRGRNGIFCGKLGLLHLSATQGRNGIFCGKLGTLQYLYINCRPTINVDRFPSRIPSKIGTIVDGGSVQFSRRLSTAVGLRSANIETSFPIENLVCFRNEHPLPRMYGFVRFKIEAVVLFRKLGKTPDQPLRLGGLYALWDWTPAQQQQQLRKTREEKIWSTINSTGGKSA
ncbi:unnamed protein product, partial [Nesidiocoris tenuis]